jgi:predicted MPP superfamily phosphohydrolase
MELRIILITAFVVLLNGGCAALQIGLLRRRQPWPRSIGIALAIWTALMAGLCILEVFAPTEWKPFMRHWLYLPIAVEMIWNLLFLQILVLGLIIATLVLGRLSPVKAPLTTSPVDLSRRQFIYLVSCGAVPAAALGAGVHGVLSQYDLRVREFRIPIAGLPPELEGFSIAHISDLHSGLFCGPKRLKIISDSANDLKADLVAVTGDIINDEMGELPDALAAIQRIESPHGIYLCEGNHDVIPGYGRVAEACAKNNLPMLFNSTQIVPVRGRRLLLGGLPWLGRGFKKRPELVSRLYPDRQEGDVRILLAHHPHLFDVADSADLVLAGHTHGGQIMFGPVGLGSLFFRYWSGLYSRRNTTLIVSNGCGDWFPCRIGAPAEIGLLRLTALKTG